MFDIGFTELLLISIVALLVLGPDKLPQAIRTTALWVGRARRSFNKVKSEIEQELNTDDIRRQLHNESIMADLDDAKKKARKIGDDTRRSVNEVSDEVSNTVREGALHDGLLSRRNRSGSGDHADAPDSADSPASADDTAAGDDAGNSGSTSPEHEEDRGDEASAGQAESSAEENLRKQQPATDFYNNPGGQIVTMKGSHISTARSRDPESERDQDDDSTDPASEQTGTRRNDKD